MGGERAAEGFRVARQAALRETVEETGLRLRAQALVDLGRFRYTVKKDLHLFATHMPRIDVSRLRCESHYLDHFSGRRVPEMDGYGWFAFARVPALCTPKMAAVLGARMDLGRVLQDLLAEQADAEPFMMPMSARAGDDDAAIHGDPGVGGRDGLLDRALECGGRA